MRAIHQRANRMVISVAAGALSDRFETPPTSRFRLCLPCDTLTQVGVELFDGKELLDSQFRAFLTSTQIQPANQPTDRLVIHRTEALP